MCGGAVLRGVFDRGDSGAGDAVSLKAIDSAIVLALVLVLAGVLVGMTI